MEKFKPKKTEKELISIRIDSNLLSQIDTLSGTFNLSRNEFIVQSLLFAINNLESVDNK